MQFYHARFVAVDLRRARVLFDSHRNPRRLGDQNSAVRRVSTRVARHVSTEEVR